MTEQARPDLSARSRPKPAADAGDPADPVGAAPERTAAASSDTSAASPTADTQRGPRLAPISTAAPTFQVQYRLTADERDVLLRMQEARGDKRGIDTFRWFLATYGEDAIRAAPTSQR